jgi:predicted permease
MRGWWTRLRAHFTRDTRLDEEIAEHLGLLAAEHERRGLSRSEARLAALRDFGGVAQVRENYRSQSRLPLVDTLGQDLRYAARQLRKSPVFAVAAVLTLGLGLGANTAVFRMLDAVLLWPLPAPHPSELVRLQPLNFGKPSNMSFPAYRAMAKRDDLIREAWAADDYFSHKEIVRGRGAAKIEHARLATGAYFHCLGVSAVQGRVFAEDDDRPGAPPVAVISYAVWDRVFGRSPDAVGAVLEFDSTPVTIIGIAPKKFSGDRVFFSPDVWLPMSLQPRLMASNWLEDEHTYFADAMARLRPGVSPARAQQALEPVFRRVVTGENWRKSEQYHLRVDPGAHGITLPQFDERLGEPLKVLMWTVALVLIIACCNLANLMMARGAGRTHEIGVRLAMGASRARLVRQLLTESLLLSLLGTALGVALAQWGIRLLLSSLVESDLPMDLDFGWRILAFIAAAAISATCLFGVAPAFAGTRLDIRSALQASRRTQSQSRPRQLMGKAFVVAQVSMCLLLLSGAALLSRSLHNLRQFDWGFRAQKLLLADIVLDPVNDYTPESRRRLAAQAEPLLARLRSLPGVESVALANGAPLGNFNSSSQVAVPGRDYRETDQGRLVAVSPQFFETWQIPLLAGRAITRADHAKATKVAVLGATAAKLLFGTAKPIGRYLTLGSVFQAKEALQIIGVARDVYFNDPAEIPGIVVYTALEQEPIPFSSVALRTSGIPTALAEPLRAALREMDRDLATNSIQPAADTLDDRLGDHELLAILTACFGVLAVALACVGLYGVIAYAVERRTQEIGIRLALGSGRRRVVTLIMREVGWLLGIGIAIGSAASLGGISAMRALLFGLHSADAVWVALAAAVLLVVTAAAAFVPARRAAQLNPLDALRQE